MTTWTPRSDVCPHFGRARDPASYIGYHSPGNRCHRLEAPEKVTFAHQARYCLAEKHRKCGVFSDQWSGRFPDELRLSRRQVRRRRRRPAWKGRSRLGFAAIGILLVGAWLVFGMDKTARAETDLLRRGIVPTPPSIASAAQGRQWARTAAFRVASGAASRRQPRLPTCLRGAEAPLRRRQVGRHHRRAPF